jgi:hypothetical protein
MVSMREVVEFRIVEKFAPLLFAEGEGKRLGTSVRKVELETTDPRYARVGELQKSLRQNKGKSFFHGWIINYKYSSPEIDAASLLRLKITSVFEPAGEECGTKYDESTACQLCGAGAKQVTALYLPEKRIPRSKDISRTIAGEIVVSRKIKELFARHEIKGAQMNPVRHSQKSSSESSDWFQLMLTDHEAEIAPPTRVGVAPFDEDEKGACRCSNGDTLGLNLLSELSIKASTKLTADLMGTRQFISCRRGLLRPEREILISQRLYRLLDAEKIKGYKVEVAHVV